MKNPFKFFAIFLVLITFSVFGNNSIPQKENPPKERIEIVFNRTLNFTDLANIKFDLAGKGISIDYKKLEFDETGELLSIDFKVDCKDGFAGSAGTSSLSNQIKFGFFRDYSKTSSSPFGVGEISNQN